MISEGAHTVKVGREKEKIMDSYLILTKNEAKDGFL